MTYNLVYLGPPLEILNHQYNRTYFPFKDRIFTLNPCTKTSKYALAETYFVTHILKTHKLSGNTKTQTIEEFWSSYDDIFIVTINSSEI